MTPFNEYWLETGAAVPVDIETTAILLREIQRLRSKEQKPVAWIKEQELAYMSAAAGIGEAHWKTNLGLRPESGDVPLYTAPLPPIYTTPIPPSECQTEEEKRAFAFGWWKAMEKKKQWVGLTDEDIAELHNKWAKGNLWDGWNYERAIEAKLREKNYG
jgi:hypothetical protein